MKESFVVIEISDYAGFERQGFREIDLSVNDSQVITYSGNIALYIGNRIVVR